jgi:hypothetical protein
MSRKQAVGIAVGAAAAGLFMVVAGLWSLYGP